MGWILTTFNFAVLALTVLFFAPNLPPHYEFKVFKMSEPRELTGALKPNDILDKATVLPLDSEIVGPESIEIRGNEEIFSGVVDGRLVQIKNGKVSNVGDFGVNCGGKNELACGRITGIRFDKQGKLLVCDVGNGILRVDVDSGKWEKLISLDSNGKEKEDGLHANFPNDIDFDKNGNIYWSDSTTIGDKDSLMLEVLAGPSGRLVKFEGNSGKNTVLISDLHLANGVQLSPNEDFVLVAETLGGRVWRYHLKGKLQGQKDVFVDNLPGTPDNIRPSGRGSFFITIALPQLPNASSPINVIGGLPKVRRFIVRMQYLVMNALAKLEEFFPSVILKDAILYVKEFGPLFRAAADSKKAIIVEVDYNGKIIGSLQNDKGEINSLSQTTVGKEWTYFASPSNLQIYRMKTSDISK